MQAAGSTVILVVLALRLAHAQPEAAVVVEVRSAGQPVAGARVSVGERSGATDAAGVYRVTVPAGEATILVEAPGWAPAAATVEVPASGEIRVVVDLQRLPVIEESVVVTATRSGTRLQNQPLRVEVIDREEIEEKALMTPGSVAMLLGETTGLRVQTTAPSLGAANVRIQGLRGRYTQLVADGLPLYGAQGDSFSLLQVPPLDLEQVEVIKGVASALYGASALGGVINLVSRRPQDEERELLVNRTSLGGTDVTAWLAPAPRGAWSWTLLGGYHGQRGEDTDGDGWTDLAGYDRGLVRPRLFHDNGLGRTAFVTLGLMAEGRWGGTLEGALAPDGRPFEERLETRRMDAGAVARWLTARGRVVAVRGSVMRLSQDRRFGDARERGERMAWFGEASLQGVSGRHTWVVGAAFQQDRYEARDVATSGFRFSAPALFAQDEITIVPALSLAVSGRVDAHTEYGALASPRVSVLVRPGAGWTARVSSGLGSFAPTPFTEETDETGLARLDPRVGLKAERAWGVSADVTRSRGAVEVTVTGFGSVVRDPVQLREIGETRVALVNASEPTRTWGAELLVRYRREGFVAMATHNWTRSTELDVDDGGRREVPLTPAHTSSLNAIWEGEGWGRFGIEVYHIGRQALEDNPYRAHGRTHVLVGALGERRVGRWRLFLNAENLLDVRQTRDDPLLLGSRRPDGRWTVDAWAPLDGRVFNGGLRVSF